jgi:hypothetical protein
MIDPAVERQYADCKELLQFWRTFHEYFTIGVKGENLTHENEESFLELKSKIAMLHDSFMEALSHDQNIGQEVLNIITRAITLKHLNRQSAADIKKMEIEWHESYLLLNDTIGALEDKRAELSKVSETQFRAGKAAGVARQRAANFFGSFYLKAAVILAVVLSGTVGVQMSGIYNYNDLGKIGALETPYAMVKGVWRSFSPDSPWVNIATSDHARKAFASWPGGVKTPTSVDAAATPQDLLNKVLLPAVTEPLSKATEYRKETALSTGMSGEAYIHTFLLVDADTARKVEEDWNKYYESPAAAAVKSKFAIIRNVNVVTIITADNSDLVNNLRVNVYGQR